MKKTLFAASALALGLVAGTIALPAFAGEEPDYPGIVNSTAVNGASMEDRKASTDREDTSTKRASQARADHMKPNEKAAAAQRQALENLYRGA